ncbi:hypothetical protein MWU78_09485 [Arenibacter sp. F26102]|uniref:hypothetical protein n=1 Tax=Arenibacter sp. F26102 TaxID=2926416 RepID=UPI001FF54393|nr:hypothetical protein [Arenibacter sp. F26102]MCK0145875.1 hypothetical protein [Arenibacter sp. F26102]
MGNPIKTTIPKLNIILSVLVIACLLCLSFYSMYGGTFIFNRIENYIFPFVTIIHFLFMYVLWFKITENEYPDMIMKNIEYIMYGILLVYLYEISETVLVLASQNEFQNHVIPSSFMPMGILIISLQSLLVLLTIWSFVIRKQRVGKYDFDYLNNHIDAWE